VPFAYAKLAGFLQQQIEQWFGDFAYRHQHAACEAIARPQRRRPSSLIASTDLSRLASGITTKWFLRPPSACTALACAAAVS